MPPRAPALPPEQRRAALVAATLPLVRERGSRVSTREIAEAAGVAEGTIFRVFGSKDELVHACLHQAFETDGVVAALVALDHHAPLEQRLSAAVDLLQEHLRGVFSLMFVLREAGQHLPGPPGATKDAARERRSEEAVEAALLDLVGDDARRLRVPPQRLLGYLRMLTLSSVHPMMARSTASAEEIVDVVLHGLLDEHHRTTDRTTRGI